MAEPIAFRILLGGGGIEPTHLGMIDEADIGERGEPLAQYGLDLGLQLRVEAAAIPRLAMAGEMTTT